MKILFWTELFTPLIGGAAILNEKLVRALAARGHDVTVLASLQGQDLPEVDQLDGIPVYRLPFWTTLNARDPEAFFALRGRILELKRTLAPELIHLSFTGASGLLHLQTANPAIPTVAAVHVDPTTGGSSPVLAGRVLDAADWITGTSRWILDAVHRAAPGVVDRSSCIYNGVETPVELPRPVPDGPARLLVLGRVAAEKGVDVAIRASVRLAARHPGLRLTVVGDGPAMPEMKALVQDLGAEDVVEFRGWVPPTAVWKEFSQHTVLLVPSTWEEAFGMVAVEAGLMERPVVASRVGGLPEVIADGSTGLTVPPNDPDALAAAVTEILSAPDGANAMGKAGRQRVLETFGWDRYVDAYEELYLRVLGRAGTPGSLMAGVER